ncbi:MAG: hypothetical protein V7785_21825 [Bermanella sp.]
MDIQQWCAKQDVRDYLKSPFNFNGKTLASNGHVLIAVPERAGLPSIYEGLKKGVTKLLQIDGWEFSALDYQLELPEKVECEACKGHKKITVNECKECNGEAVVCFENDFSDYTCDCASCDGHGGATIYGQGDECEGCYGEGKQFIKWSRLKVCGVDINPNYYQLLRGIENLEVCSDGIKTLYFKASDVQGCVLGMK